MKLLNVLDYCELDIEYGNSIGFYSASQKDTSSWDSNTLGFAKKIYGILEKTKIEIDDLVICNIGDVDRKTIFLASEDSELFDLVSRFVVRTSKKSANINGNEYIHLSKNLYYQFDVKENSIINIETSDGKLVFRPVKISPPLGFKQVVYIRDEKKENGMYVWIVHHRLIADEHQSKMILRCCHPRFEGVMMFQRFIPIFLKRLFFRIREKKYPSFPIMTVGESVLKKNDVVSLETRVTLEINSK